MIKKDQKGKKKGSKSVGDDVITSTTGTVEIRFDAKSGNDTFYVQDGTTIINLTDVENVGTLTCEKSGNDYALYLDGRKASMTIKDFFDKAK